MSTRKYCTSASMSAGENGVEREEAGVLPRVDILSLHIDKYIFRFTLLARFLLVHFYIRMRS